MAREFADVAWDAAPPTSHVYAFRLADAEEFGLSVSQLFVKFRDKKTGGIKGEGWYYMEPAFAREIVEAMRASPHPYGEVLYPRVVKTGRGEWHKTG